MARCDNCEAEATRESISGRPLCHECYSVIVGGSAAGTAIAGGAGLGQALTTGFGAKAYAGASEDEAEAARARRTKLDATEGFWRRLWVRIIG